MREHREGMRNDDMNPKEKALFAIRTAKVLSAIRTAKTAGPPSDHLLAAEEQAADGVWLDAAHFCAMAEATCVGRPAALCRVATAACIEAWQTTRPEKELREDMVAAVEHAVSVIADAGDVHVAARVKSRMGSEVWDALLRELTLRATERTNGLPVEARAACSKAARALLLWLENTTKAD